MVKVHSFDSELVQDFAARHVTPDVFRVIVGPTGIVWKAQAEFRRGHEAGLEAVIAEGATDAEALGALEAVLVQHFGMAAL